MCSRVQGDVFEEMDDVDLMHQAPRTVDLNSTTLHAIPGGASGNPGTEAHRPSLQPGQQSRYLALRQDERRREYRESTDRNSMIDAQMVFSLSNRARDDFHNRPRLIVTSRPLVLSAPVLDRQEWNHSFFTPFFCIRGKDARTARLRLRGSLDDSDNAYGRGRRNPTTSPEPHDTSALGYCCWRCFCLRCSVAEQTHLLHLEDNIRGRVPHPFCCENLFGNRGFMSRTFWSIFLCDLLTFGLPCGFCYHGMGTALYGSRLRYLVRCRYRIEGTVAMDMARMMCCPLFAVDQQALEMLQSDLIEHQDIGRIMI